MKYSVEIGLNTMIYIPSFINIGSGIQKLTGEGGFTGTQTHRPHSDLISLLSFFKTRKLGYKQQIK
jgi:hypothetical protein